jgi:hypothetical protein
MATVFVYYKNDEIRVLDAEEAGTQHNQLIKENWKHTATLDVCRWIEYLFNKAEDVDVFAEIRELNDINHN